MERYFRALNKTRNKLLGLQNVVGLGIGHKETGAENTGEPAFIVYVEKKLPVDSLMRGHVVPEKIGGLITDVVEIGVVRALGIRTSKERPAHPGVSIGHFKSTAGTLGAVVKDKQTGELVLLSNNHVLANGSSILEARAKTGDPILQPGPYDGGTLKDRIGTLLRYVPLEKSVAKSDCPVASSVARGGNFLLNLVKKDYEIRFYKHFNAENTVDCALAKLDSPDLVESSILEIGEVAGVAEARPGNMVQKSGRTTGLTNGKIKSVGTVLQVEMDREEKVWFSDQVVTELISQPGDSGSLVLDMENRAVGLLFAGSDKLTVINRISNVMDRLGFEF
jgi:hypothetical protein